MNILVAHSNSLRMDPKQLRKMQPYPPLGTLYAAAALRKEGWNVSLFDATFTSSHDDFRKILSAVTPDVFVICEDVFNFISKMCLSEMRLEALGMLADARDRGCKTIAAGPDMSAHPDTYLRNGADYVVRGEPDRTLVELCRSLEHTDTSAIRSLPGIAFLAADGSIQCASDREPESDLSLLAPPAWDLIDIDRYRAAWTSVHGRFSLIVAASRGCPFHCRWCAKPIWGRHHAVRAPEDVVDEMSVLKSRYAPDHLWFADDNFGYPIDWLERFTGHVNRRSVKIPFTIQTRVDLLSEPAIRCLASAGCREVWIGAESGNQGILDAMNKGIRVEAVAPAVENLRTAGIRSGLFIQFGYPGETLDEIRDTIRMIRLARPDDIGISVCYPLPGAELYPSARKHLGHKTNWRHSDDLDMLFQGAYDTPFYRKLHEVLHLEMDLIRESAGVFPAISDHRRDTLFKLTDAWFELGRLERISRTSQTTDFDDD